MNITHVTETDLPGKIFNGYELSRTLNELGYNTKQIVIKKHSDSSFVESLLTGNELFIRDILISLEQRLSMNSCLFPYSKNLLENDTFNSSDIIHYHLIHNNFLSIRDFKGLTVNKKSVWTIHDPWIVTGHCIHPLTCSKWKDGCRECENLYDTPFNLNIDKASELWKIKKSALENINIDLIVASDFTMKYLTNSPITKHLSRIHKIPFGIDLDKINVIEKSSAKEMFNIPSENTVIGFRNEDNPIKGVKYIFEALSKLENKENITIVTVGSGRLPLDIVSKFQVLELGWQNDEDMMNNFYNSVDIFLMPSLAETFGLMAIEAMAHKCAVVVFKDTVLEEITFANECGLAVEYKNSYLLRKAIQRLIYDADELTYRANQGREIVGKHYKYSDYVDKHIKLYENILERN